MAAILKSAIMDSPIFHKKELHSFILTQLDDGSHLEICHVGFRHCHLGFRHLVIFSQINSKTLSDSMTNWPSELKLIQYSIWLTDSTWWWQPSWTLPSCIQPCCTKKLHSCILTQIDDCSHLEFCYLGFSHFAQKKLHLFILTQLDDGSHLEICHVGFRHCHLGFRHLVIFSWINSKTLSLHSDSDSN